MKTKSSPESSLRLSIVIPNYNGEKLLEQNLPAVVRACRQWQKKGWEIVIVDDASDDGSVAFLGKNYPQVKVIVHRKNRRFAATCNTGVKSAGGKVVVLLNIDVSPESNFLKPLLAVFKNSQVFAVGCKEKDQRDGKVVYSGRSEGEFRRGFLLHRRAQDQNKTETLWATGGSMAVDRAKWLELGGMDTLYRPAYWEDIDLSWRARKKGWQVLFEPKSVVNHRHETTNLKVFGKEKMKKFAYKNQFLFVWKNGDVLMLAGHLFWLPYHLVIGLMKRDSLFWQGFLLALLQLPELLIKKIAKDR